MTARGFTGVRLFEDNRHPDTGEVGLERIKEYAREAGRLKGDGSPNYSEQLRHMVTAEALRIEKRRKLKRTDDQAGAA